MRGFEISLRRLCILFHLLFAFALVACEPHEESPSTVLSFKDLMPENPKDYDKMRPPKKQGKPTRVFFHVTVMGIDSINENSMTYVADIFFAQSWKDHRLRFPDNMNSSYRLLEVDWLKDMWRPDSFFKNAKQVTFQTMTIPNHYVWLHKDSTILYMVKLTLTLSCAMNYAIYPHDTQVCKMQMESLSHTTEDLIFDWDKEVPLEVASNIELPQFDLVRNHTADCTQVYFTGNFTCLEVVFQLKRRLGYYLFHTYMPTCLIVIMSWVSFWIKPEAAPARVTLGVTSLLTLSTQHAKSQASLPPVSYIKIIDMFMSTCTVFVFLALMEYALVNIVLGDGPETPPKKNPPPEKDTKSLQVPSRYFSDKENGRVSGVGGISATLARPHQHPYATENSLHPHTLHMTPGHTHGTLTLAHGTPIHGPLAHGGHPHHPTLAHGGGTLHHRPHHHHMTYPPQGGTSHGGCSHAFHNTAPIHGMRPHHDHHPYGGGDPMLAPLPIVPPPPPPPARMPGPTAAQKRRAKAILVDRFSRVFFPSTFGLINGLYWIIFWLYL
ncbi:glycine receptor subunit alpha-4-like [Macrobrachium rosenbergii]|uniref:glycine receptor subunit alpha-4-like n=1 Tax=Macrobrachium rosenbergii TaxID=79674 RepID=UPI0034D3D8BC